MPDAEAHEQIRARIEVACQAFGETAPSSYTILINSLNKSSKWKLLVNQDGTSIYELPPGQG